MTRITVALEELTSDFTLEERARVAARTAELLEKEVKLRETAGNRDRRVIRAGELIFEARYN